MSVLNLSLFSLFLMSHNLTVFSQIAKQHMIFLNFSWATSCQCVSVCLCICLAVPKVRGSLGSPWLAWFHSFLCFPIVWVNFLGSFFHFLKILIFQPFLAILTRKKWNFQHLNGNFGAAYSGPKCNSASLFCVSGIFRENSRGIFFCLAQFSFLGPGEGSKFGPGPKKIDNIFFVFRELSHSEQKNRKKIFRPL